MSLKQLKSDLQRVQIITDKWDSIPQVGDIERELVLDKLKSIYEQVMFFEREREVFANQQQEPMQWIDLDANPEEGVADVSLQHEAVSSVVMDLSDANEDVELSVDEPLEQAKEPVPEPVLEPAIVPEVEPATQVEPEREPSSEPFHNAATFQLKPKLDRSVIMSIYGDYDPVSEPATALEPEPEAELGFESEPKSESESDLESEPEQIFVEELSTATNNIAVISEPQLPLESDFNEVQQPELQEEESPFEMIVMSSHAKSEPKLEVVTLHGAEKPHVQTIGDVINVGEPTIGDTLALNSNKIDVATRIVTSQSTGLRKSIGINDKFLMIRDMFSGDAAAFERAIRRLEEFDDLNDALLYIHDTYHWNPNSDAVKLLIELLTRKLS